MNEIEKDFVEFMAMRYNRDILQDYLDTKKSFDFSGKEFKALGILNYKALRVFFSDKDEASAIESYQYFAYQDLLRMLSYSFNKNSTIMGYIRTFFKKIKKGDLKRVKIKNLPQKLLSGTVSPVIVDYGCGLGYLSFELARLSPKAKIFLIDIESIKSDFAVFRFKKRGFNVEFISVTKEIPYPKLPEHDICIAQEVMEHLHSPLLACGNIFESMKPGGYLYGDFSNHKNEPFHVSADLGKLREIILQKYNQVENNLYEKK